MENAKRSEALAKFRRWSGRPTLDEQGRPFIRLRNGEVLHVVRAGVHDLYLVSLMSTGEWIGRLDGPALVDWMFKRLRKE